MAREPEQENRMVPEYGWIRIVVIGLLAGTVSLVAWRASVQVEQAAIARTIELVTIKVHREIELQLATRTQALHRMADRWARRGGTSKDEWESDAAGQVEYFDSYQAIEWVDTSFHVRWIVPLEGNEGVLGMESAFEPVRRRALEDARDHRSIAYTDPIDLAQGGKGFLVYVPVIVGERFEGFILGVYKLTRLLDKILPPDRIAAGYGIRVRSGDETIYQRVVAGGGPATTRDSYGTGSHQHQVTLGTVSLMVDVWPGDAALGEMRSILPYVVLFGGLSVSCLLTVVARLMQVTRGKSRQLSHQLNRAKEQVNIEIDQRELAQEDLSLRMIAIESSFDGVAILDAQGRYVYLNKSYASIYGYECQADLIGLMWDVKYFPHQVEGVREKVFGLLEKNGRWEGELEGKKLNNEPFCVEASLTSLPDGGLICICRDIAGRKAAEHALRESEHRLQEILDNTSAVVYMKDLAGKYLMINRRFTDLLDIKWDVLKDQTDYDVFPKEMADAFRANDREVIHRGEMIQCEEIALHKDGPHTYVSVKFPMRDPSGEIYAVAGISTDITDLKKAEMALRDSEQRFDLAVRGSQDGLWDWFDVENDEEWWSPRFYELLGYDDGEIPSTLSVFRDLLHPDDRDDTFEAERAHFEEGQPFDIEYRLKTKGGAYRWFRARGETVRDGSGKAVRMAGSIQDVHDRKLAEQELQHFAGQLEKSNRELENFVHTVSHDLKSPLVTFMGYLGHLKREVDLGQTDGLLGYVGFLERAAVRMRKIIDDLLEISTIGRVEQEREDIDVKRLVESIIDDLSDTIRDRGAVVRVEDALPTVHLDKTRLRQVFQNLLVNALKYGCVGEAPLIRVGGEHRAQEIAFYVSDNGPGIEPKYHQKIFGIFQRLQSDEDGTGIGLSIVERVAEIHGGRAWVESQAGEGATFWIAFPACPIHDTGSEDAIESLPPGDRHGGKR